MEPIIKKYVAIVKNTGLKPNDEEFWYKVREEGLKLFKELIDTKQSVTDATKIICYADLKRAECSDVQQEVHIIGSHCCDNCKQLDNETFPLNEALKLQPLPPKNCTRSAGCICCYGFSGVRDNNGHLIFKPEILRPEPQRQYNPHTKYGRRKMREQALANMTPAEQTSNNLLGCIILLIIVVIVGIIAFATGNETGFLKWLSR